MSEKVDQEPKEVKPIAEGEIRVTTLGRVSNYVTYAKKLLSNGVPVITIRGTGRAMSNVVETAEILRHMINGLHQVTTVDTQDRLADPKTKNTKDTKFSVCFLTIALSLDPSKVDTKAIGYQAPLTKESLDGVDVDQLLQSKRGPSEFMERINLPDEATVDDLKSFFYEKSTGPRLHGNKLKDLGVKDGGSLYFKDLGVQISWRLVFFLEYLGPLVILPLLYFFPSLFYKNLPKTRYCSQKFGFFMLMFHFLKREFETFFVHRFSKNTMPIKNLFTNCFHYWVLCAFGIGYYLFHPQYKPVLFFTKGGEKITLFALYFVFQFLTFMTHVTLSRLRPKGTTVRGIPMNWGFQYVSCANYFWELLVWVDVALFVNTFTAYFFAFAVLLILANWAKKKHLKYHKEFPNYCKKRKALIPFLF